MWNALGCSVLVPLILHQYNYMRVCFACFMSEFRSSYGSVVEHCASSAKGCGFNSQGTHILIKQCIAWMHCKSLWIKVSAKCINEWFCIIWVALEYKLQHVSDEKNATFISENITVRRFITSGSLHYYSKTHDYSTKPLQWSSYNAIKLKMMYHRTKQLTVKVTKTCKIHFNGHN